MQRTYPQIVMQLKLARPMRLNILAIVSGGVRLNQVPMIDNGEAIILSIKCRSTTLVCIETPFFDLETEVLVILRAKVC